MDNVVILAAGKSTRLNGYSKLLVQAAGTTVLEWHMRALKGSLAGVVVRPGEAQKIYLSGWRGPIVESVESRGPAGGLVGFVVVFSILVCPKAMMSATPCEQAGLSRPAREP